MANIKAARELRRAQDYIDELERLVMSQKKTIREQQQELRRVTSERNSAETELNELLRITNTQARVAA
jgi:uncharacterized coiled-coil protein SlyX